MRIPSNPSINLEKPISFRVSRLPERKGFPGLAFMKGDGAYQLLVFDSWDSQMSFEMSLLHEAYVEGRHRRCWQLSSNTLRPEGFAERRVTNLSVYYWDRRVTDGRTWKGQAWDW